MESRKWLPADTRTRLIDLCKDRKITQAKLADVLGIDRSALSRFISGKTDSMSHEYVIRIAKFFKVSTDFILGETDDPGRINYDIEELGLTVKAAECLYTRRVDPSILCRLLEHESCGDLVHKIGLFLDGTLTSSIAAQNQVYYSVIDLLDDHASEHPADKQAAATAAQTIRAIKRPQYTEKDGIHSDFDQILLDIKKDSLTNEKRAALLTKNTMKNMTFQMKKGSKSFNLRKVPPKEIVNRIIGQLNMTGIPESVKPEFDCVIARLREDLTDFFNILKTVKEQAE